MSLIPLTFFQGILGYVGNSLPSVVLSRFFRLSPIAMSNIQVASNNTVLDDEQRKSSMVCISLVRSSTLSIAERMSSRISNAIPLVSEDKNSFLQYTFFEFWVQILMIADYVNRRTCFVFQELLGIHQQKRIGCFCIHKQIDVTTSLLTTSCSRSK